MSDNMLYNSLLIAGFGSNEALVLTNLLYMDSVTAGAIARRVKLKRPTVYAALDTLVEKGYVNKKKSPKAQVFSCIPAESILAQLESDSKQKLSTLNHANDVLRKIFDALPRKKSREIEGFELESVTSDKAVYDYLYSSLTSQSFCAIFDPALLSPGAKKVALRFLEETAATKNHIREIAKAGPQMNWYLKYIKNPNHIVKAAPKEWDIMGDLMISANKVTLISYHEQHNNAVRITHKPLVLILRSMFDLIWDVLPNV
jgi:DNA-binding MarR family transcriptional regulator